MHGAFRHATLISLVWFCALVSSTPGALRYTVMWRDLTVSWLIQRLDSSCGLDSLEEVGAVVELLQESSQWFSGGTKEMKVQYLMLTDLALSLSIDHQSIIFLKFMLLPLPCFLNLGPILSSWEWSKFSKFVHLLWPIPNLGETTRPPFSHLHVRRYLH